MNSSCAVHPAWIKEAVTAAMPHTIQVGTYGLTEAAGTVSTSRLSDSYEQRTGRCGVPLDEWEVRIVDVESGRDCGVDERGEIVVRGPNMLKGYYNAPDKTAEVDRKSVVEGKSVSVRVDLGGRCSIKQKTQHKANLSST